MLAGAFRRSLELAVEHGCTSIALPALSAGAYGYPLAEAARIAIGTAGEFLKASGQPELVRFVLFDRVALAAFDEAVKSLRDH